MPDNANLDPGRTGGANHLAFIKAMRGDFTAPHSPLFSFHGVSMAVILVLVLSGCASMPWKSDSPASFTSPGQASSLRALPLPEAGPPPASLAPTGSLWAANSKSLVADVKAAKIGDIVTITVSESSTASKQATTQTSRAQNFQGSLSFSGVGAGSGGGGVSSPKGAFSFGPYSGAFSRSFNGAGATSSADTVTTYMTATVVDILPNGNLLIRGSRWTKVNDSLQQIILEGVVRPDDISRSNTVLSQNVAEAKIFLVGKGPVAQNQKPGWLGRIWDIISPF
ncbi:MAG TPA: flagellar basal body L-ring protein FlgH [Syntrophobacteraceae bacterium]|nr:flagellar basal body L-ring protein FlgH [Syntrophobacteraceae bacterium]